MIILVKISTTVHTKSKPIKFNYHENKKNRGSNKRFMLPQNCRENIILVDDYRENIIIFYPDIIKSLHRSIDN